jgi:hypothetical protein
MNSSWSENTKVKKDIINNNDSEIIIVGEGHDEWQHRYFKFGIQNSDANIPPFSAKEILDSPNALFTELTDAGANVFRKSVRNDLFQRLDDLQSQPAKFKVVSRLGWNSGAFVLPKKLLANPARPWNHRSGISINRSLASTRPGELWNSGSAKLGSFALATPALCFVRP